MIQFVDGKKHEDGRIVFQFAGHHGMEAFFVWYGSFGQLFTGSPWSESEAYEILLLCSKALNEFITGGDEWEECGRDGLIKLDCHNVTVDIDVFKKALARFDGKELIGRPKKAKV